MLEDKPIYKAPVYGCRRTGGGMPSFSNFTADAFFLNFHRGCIRFDVFGDFFCQNLDVMAKCEFSVLFDVIFEYLSPGSCRIIMTLS